MRVSHAQRVRVESSAQEMRGDFDDELLLN